MSAHDDIADSGDSRDTVPASKSAEESLLSSKKSAPDYIENTTAASPDHTKLIQKSLDQYNQGSFIDEVNDTVGSPPIILRRRSKSNSNIPDDNSPRDMDSPVTSIKSAENISFRALRNHADTERPSSRNSVVSAVADDVAAGDVFSRMNNLKSRISNSSTTNIARCESNDSMEDGNSRINGVEEEDTVILQYIFAELLVSNLMMKI